MQLKQDFCLYESTPYSLRKITFCPTCSFKEKKSDPHVLKRKSLRNVKISKNENPFQIDIDFLRKLKILKINTKNIKFIKK